MKRIVPAIFIAVAAVLAVVFFVQKLSVDDTVVARSRVVTPIVDSASTDSENLEDKYEDQLQETSFIELANDETLISTVTMDIDGDGYDDQISVLKTPATPYLILVVGLYNPIQAKYERIFSTYTNITQVRTFACTSLDVIGNHRNSLVYQGIAENGHSVLRIFQGSRHRRDFKLEVIGDFDTEGTVFIQQVERPESYQLSQAKGESFPVWVYNSEQQPGRNVFDQVQIKYDWNEDEGKYIEVSRNRVAGSRIAAEELARIQDGTVETFTKFLEGLWYKTENTSSDIRYIFFDAAREEIIFHYMDSEEVYTWINSNLRRNGMYFTSVNQSIENLQRRVDITLVNVDEVRVRIQDDVRMIIGESPLWDGNYKKMSPSQALKLAKQEETDFVAALATGPAWTAADGSYLVFTDSTWEVTGTDISDTGLYMSLKVSGTQLLQFRSDKNSYFSGVYLPEYQKKKTTKTVTKRGRKTAVEVEVDDTDTIVLQSVNVSPDGFYKKEERAIILKRSELKKSKE